MMQWWTEERISQVDGSSIGSRGQAQADWGRYEDETNEDFTMGRCMVDRRKKGKGG
jgi:hypothetical protein